MGQDVNTADPRRSRKILQQLFQRVARCRRAFLVRTIGEQLRTGWPGEENRHAGEIAVGDDLRQPEAGLVEPRIEAVDVDKHVPAHADPSGNLRGDFLLERVGLQPAFARHHEVPGAAFRRDAWPFDHAGLMTGRDADAVHREPRAASGIIAFGVLARRYDENLDHLGVRSLRGPEHSGRAGYVDAHAASGKAERENSERQDCGQFSGGFEPHRGGRCDENILYCAQKHAVSPYGVARSRSGTR